MRHLLTSDTQKGNALFLILIAVALFAALSYAVTQTGRGGGSTSKEQLSLAVAQLLQTGADMKSAFTRMSLTGSDWKAIYFSTGPGGTTSLNSGPTFDPCTSGADCFWSPDGGGVAFPSFSQSVLEQSNGVNGPGLNLGFFSYADARSIKGAGLDNIADPYMLIFNVSNDICVEINRQLGLGAVRPLYTITSPANPQPAGTVLRDGGFNPPSPQGCFANASYNYFYYALAEN